MRLKRNYYEVMGLSRSATAQEIKHKYHDLARQFHPDRAKDKELAQRLFAQINQAYKTLSNAQERSRYDEILDSEAAVAAKAGWPSPMSAPAYAAPVQPAASHAARGAKPGPRPDAGAGGARPTPAAPRPGPTASMGAGASMTNQAHSRRVGVVELLELAQGAYARGDANQALRICKQVLSAIPDNLDALRLAGDIHSDAFQYSDAIKMYQSALRVQPGNFMLQDKIKRLEIAMATLNVHDQAAAKHANGKHPAPKQSNGVKPQEKVNLFKRIIGGAR